MAAKEKGQIRRMLAWDWGGLLCFQAAHKIVGFLILLPLFRTEYARLLQSAGRRGLEGWSLLRMLESPRALAAALFWLAAFLYYFYLEAIFLALYCDRAWRRDTGSLLKLTLRAARQGLELFRPRNLPLLLGMAVLLPVGCWPFTGSFGLAGQGAEYLAELLGRWAWLLWAPSLAALAAMAFFFFFGFYLLAAEGQDALGAWRKSRRALAGRKRRAAKLLLRGLAPLALALLLLYLAAVGLTAGLASLRWQGEEAAAVFRLDYLRWSRLFRAVAFAAASSVYSALAVSAYCRLEGRLPPPAQDRRTVERPPARRLRLISMALGLAALAVFSKTELGGRALYWTRQPVQVIAHRGGAQLAPENTLEALEAARESGADGAEIDVRQTRDGQLVLLHDASLRRTHGLSVNIWQLDYSQVARLHRKAPIPTLAQALGLADPQLKLMIELKTSDQDRNLAERAAALMRRYQPEEGEEAICSAASMDLEILARIKQIAPEIQTIYITSLLREEDYELDYIDGYSLRHSFLTPAVSARLRQAGKQVYAWTVNTQRSIQWALYCQPDGIITDNPYLAQFFMESGRENKALEFWTTLFYGYCADPVFQLD